MIHKTTHCAASHNIHFSHKSYKSHKSHKSLYSQRIRIACLWLAVLCSALTGAHAAPKENAAWAALKAGKHIVLFRHAIAPGGGDPMTVVIDDCTTQRNLDAAGRAQSAAIGRQFKQRTIAVGEVWTSQWCRTRDTATLAFGAAAVRDERAFNSFFANPGAEPAQTVRARQLLLNWLNGQPASDLANLVVVTHQVNITALTGIVPHSGEGVVLKHEGQTLTVVGRLQITASD